MHGNHRFALVAFVVQASLIAAYALCAEYDYEEGLRGFDMLQQVHLMIFVGFGFLMTFLKKYAFGALGFNMFIAALCIQVDLLVENLFRHGFPVRLHMSTLLEGNFAAAAVLITYGALLGKVGPTQLVVLSVIEVVIYSASTVIGQMYFGALDVGGSIFVHSFGAFFGLAAARMLYSPHHNEHESNSSVYRSDVTAMIGTLFLWFCWPTFNAAVAATEEAKYRAVINTYMALTACVMVTFMVSSLVERHGRFEMVHVQNATLAGGVAVGAIADMNVTPAVAMVVGCVAAFISVIGYHYVSPALSNRLHIVDTCGVLNLHGLPGLLSAALSVGGIYLGMAEVEDVKGQVINQLLTIAVTMGAALIGGAITGVLLRFLPMLFGRGADDLLYSDEQFWVLPDDFEKQRIDGKLK